MNKKKLLLQSVGTAFLIGGVLALYISLTMFRQMPHDLWLAFHNLLVVVSLVLIAFWGYRHRAFEVSFKFMLLSVGLFFSVIMFLYIGSYAVTIAIFADKMVWIPFFYRDYNYHGFKSVSDYLNHKNNFRELLELQIVSFLICSVMYFAAGSLGYGAKAMIGSMKKSSGAGQSAV
jgi:hypothetical protein